MRPQLKEQTTKLMLVFCSQLNKHCVLPLGSQTFLSRWLSTNEVYTIWVTSALSDKPHVFQLGKVLTLPEPEIWTTGDSMQEVRISSKIKNFASRQFLYRDKDFQTFNRVLLSLKDECWSESKRLQKISSIIRCE